jgi:hypothetical protein
MTHFLNCSNNQTFQNPDLARKFALFRKTHNLQNIPIGELLSFDASKFDLEMLRAAAAIYKIVL